MNVADDTNAALKLDGFNSSVTNVSKVNNKYSHLGYITNNTNQTINLTVTIKPDFSLLINKNIKNYWLGIKIDGVVSKFTFGSSTSLQASLQLAPGQVADVEGSLTNNKNKSVSTSFGFNAVDTTGTYIMQINDTAKTPRCIICR